MTMTTVRGIERYRAAWQPSPAEAVAVPFADQVRRCAALLAGRRWAALTGAGVSTDSGIPDYRGPAAPPAQPMLHGDFLASAEARRRYWARSFHGWQHVGTVRPNDGHRALAALAGHGLCGVITQNVDGLHAAAGSDPVIDLHGRLSDVVCLACGETSARADYQRRLADLNPGMRTAIAGPAPAHRPDGDAVVGEWADFLVPACVGCGGDIKPDIVFFGDNVPRSRVADAFALVDSVDALLVAGSSLAVMSGLRFVRHVARSGRDVVIVNHGATRGDEFATLRVDAGVSEFLTALLAELAASG